MAKCECGGFLHQDTYDSRMVDEYFKRNPEEKEEVDGFLRYHGKTRNDIWFALCADCNALRVRTRSNLDKALDEHRNKYTY